MSLLRVVGIARNKRNVLVLSFSLSFFILVIVHFLRRGKPRVNSREARHESTNGALIGTLSRRHYTAISAVLCQRTFIS